MRLWDSRDNGGEYVLVNYVSSLDIHACLHSSCGYAHPGPESQTFPNAMAFTPMAPDPNITRNGIVLFALQALYDSLDRPSYVY